MEKRNTKRILKEALKYTFFLALTVVLLYFSFKGVTWNELVNGLKTANVWWIGASMAAGYVAFLIRARRWQFIIEPLGYYPSFKNTYDAVMMTYLSNFAVPRMGEVIRCGVLRKTEKIPFESLLGTVVLERVFDMVCLIVITVAVVFLRLDVFGEFIHTNLVQPFVDSASGSTLTFVYVALGALVLFIIALIVFRKQIAKLPFAGKIKKLLKGLVDGLKSGFKLKRRGAFFSYTALLWAIYWLQAFAIVLAMPETAHLTWVDALFLMVIGGLGWVAPVQGGMGAYHFIISLTLAAVYGIPRDHGVVFATISHETQALVMIVFGLISWGSILLLTHRSKKTTA